MCEVVGVKGEVDSFWEMKSNKQLYMLITSPQVFFSVFFLMNSIKFSQYRLSLVSVLMLMDHPSSSRSLISSPYLPHHFIWPKGNNKSLIHYPLTEAATRKYLITGNKLNFNHRIFLQGCTAHYMEPANMHVEPTLHSLYTVWINSKTKNIGGFQNLIEKIYKMGATPFL